MSIHPDHLGGRLVAIAALAGLESRDRDGVGHRIDIAQFEAVCGLLAEMLAAESLVPGSAVPHGNIHPDHAPWGLYRCADDDDGSESWLAVCVRSDDDWQAVLTIAGEAFDAQASWDTVAGRLVDRSEVDAAVSAWLATRSAAEVETDLQGVGVPAGRALHPAILVDHPLYVGRGFCVEVDQPGYGALLLEGPAFASAGMGPARVGPAPEPAQHTEQIARDLLGLDPEEIRSLQGIGVLDRAETDE
jgi:crotonobetainyl-CoA:carnitine CoA-transferase CaiB-like acyl-CoA transferase